MDILKNITAALIVFIALGNASIAQSADDMVKAFSESYGYESKSDYYNAIESLKKVYDRSSYETNLRLGWLNYLNQQYAESEKYYQLCIDLMPSSIEARFGYVLPAAALKDWVTVAGKYAEILGIDPMNTLANYRMGLIYYYKPDYAAARQYFEKVVSIYPFDSSSVLMMGWSNYQLGKTSEAKTYFQRALLIKPDEPSAIEGLGLIK
jgi:tetratricopeptide (TPR) repeat protein